MPILGSMGFGGGAVSTREQCIKTLGPCPGRYPNDNRQTWADGWDGTANNPEWTFNGNMAQGGGANGGTFTSTYTFDPAITISGGDTVRVRTVIGATSGQLGGTGNVVLIDGTDITGSIKSGGYYTSYGWGDVTSAVGTVFNTMVCNGTGGKSNPSIAAVEIAGEVLEQGVCSAA